jgi:signal transduction histidine kinase
MGLGLRGRILLLVLVALAPLTVMAVIGELAERSEQREHAERDLLDSSRLVRSDIERLLSGTGSMLTAFSSELAQRPGQRACERLIGLVPRATRMYSSVGVAEADGRLYCGAGQAGLIRRGSVSVRGSTWLGAATRENALVLGGFGWDPLSRMNALVAARPVPSRDSTLQRVVFAAIDIRTFPRATALKDTPHGTHFLLFDGQGTVIAEVPSHGDTAGRELDEPALAAAVRSFRRGTAEIRGPDGTSRIYGFAPVGGVRGETLFVAASRRSSDVFADPNEDLRRFFVLSVLGLVLALAVSWLMTRLLLQRWTSAVVDAARRFGAGDLSARAPVPSSFRELSDVAGALNAAAEEIERRQAEHARLLGQLVAVEEETRRRIAADIHDDTAQAVAAAGLRLDVLIAELEDPRMRETAVEVRRALREANMRLRRLLFELRPPALDRAGLATALELFLTDAFGTDGFDWRVHDRLDAEPSPETRAVLYRVALEALTNVRKHANASMVDVLLERRGLGVAVRVRDDGAGFDLPEPDAAATQGHIGLVSMRERAEAAGGRFEIQSEPGAGTIVEFWMPETNGRVS